MTLYSLKETEKPSQVGLSQVHPDVGGHQITWGRPWSRRPLVVAVACVLALLVITVAILLMAVGLHNSCEVPKAPRPQLPPESGISLDFSDQIIKVDVQNFSDVIPAASVLQDYKKGNVVTKDLTRQMCFIDKLDESFDNVLSQLNKQQWDAVKLLTKNFRFDNDAIPEGALGRLFGWRIQEHCRDTPSHLVIEEVEGPGEPVPWCRMQCQHGYQKDSLGRPLCECRPAPTEAPKVCPPVCRMYCQHGNVLNDDGCPICRCKQPPEPRVVMPTPAPASPSPSPCSRVTCRMLCEHGFALNADGCPKCQCRAPPATACPPLCRMFCEYGNEVDENNCPICKCRPPPDEAVEPRVGCPPVTCRMQCEHGYAMDDKGCPLCQCKRDPALEPRVGCPPVTCRMECEHGYAIDDKGCPLCQCKRDPDLHPHADVTATPSACPPLCRMYCQHGYVQDNNGCPTCVCNSPPARDLPTPPDGAMTTACPPLCRMFCEHGFETDERGCFKCSCRQQPADISFPVSP